MLTRAPGTRGGPGRSVPDISADGDAATGFALGMLTFPTGGGAPVYGESEIGGTSLATPLVGGLVTAAQQGEAAPFGFLNPVLYKLPRTGAFYRTLPLTRHSPALQRGEYCPAAVCGRAGLITSDDQDPSMIGYTGQVTLPGYDNMTGLGSPDGPRFSRLLRELAGS